MNPLLTIGHQCIVTLRHRAEAWRRTAMTLDSDDVLQRAYQENQTLRSHRDGLQRRVLELEGELRRVLKDIEGPWLATAEKKDDGTERYTLADLSVRLHEISKAGYTRIRGAWTR